MGRFGRGLCVLLASACLWLSQAAVADASARAEVSWVAGARTEAVQRARKPVRPPISLVAPRKLPDPRAQRAAAERATGRNGRHSAAPPRCERVYIKHCVLQR